MTQIAELLNLGICFGMVHSGRFCILELFKAISTRLAGQSIYDRFRGSSVFKVEILYNLIRNKKYSAHGNLAPLRVPTAYETKPVRTCHDISHALLLRKEPGSWNPLSAKYRETK